MRFIKTEIHKHTGMKCEACPASGPREQAALTAHSSVQTLHAGPLKPILLLAISTTSFSLQSNFLRQPTPTRRRRHSESDPRSDRLIPHQPWMVFQLYLCLYSATAERRPIGFQSQRQNKTDNGLTQVRGREEELNLKTGLPTLEQDQCSHATVHVCVCV